MKFELPKSYRRKVAAMDEHGLREALLREAELRGRYQHALELIAAEDMDIYGLADEIARQALPKGRWLEIRERASRLP